MSDSPATVTADVRVKAFVFTHGDVSYSIPRDALEDLELLEMIEDEKILSAVRRILGDEQWGRYKDQNRTESGRVDPSDLEAFLNGLFSRLNAGKS